MTIFEKWYVNLKKVYLDISLTQKNKSSTLAGVDPDSNYIVSLTTFPARLHICYLTIETLLNQKLKPKRVVLWLSSAQIKEDELPETLKRQVPRGLDIRFVEEDLRAYKKLFYSIKEFPDATIVTADDDVYYPDWWLQKLHVRQAEHPDCVICYRGHEVGLKGEEQLVDYVSWKKSASAIPSINLFPVGVSGVLYKRHFFDDEFFKKEIFMEICPSNDDIWFKATTLRNNIKCVKVFSRNVIFETIKGSQEESLFSVNVLGKQNDVQLKAVFDKYSLYHKLQ